MIAPFGLPAAAFSQEVNPTDVMAMFHKYIRDTIDSCMPPNHYLSLSMVGSVAEADDQPAVNDIANFCPPPRPIIDVFSNVRRLDAIYENILRGVTGPYRPETTEVAAAKAKLFDPLTREETPLEKAYEKYSSEYIAAVSRYIFETKKVQRGARLAEVTAAERKWKLQGARAEVDAAMWTIEKSQGKFGPEKNGRRFEILEAYRKAGLAGKKIDGTPGDYLSPASELSPTPDLWANASGWVSFHYTSHDFSNSFDATYKSNKGFGGLSLGFITLAGSGGGGDSNEHRVTSVRDFAVSFEIKRVQIRRPWLDTEVFFQPTAWTWERKQNTTVFPHVSVGLDAEGKLLTPKSVMYDSLDIGCSMLPLELLIAKNRSITLTVSKSDYQKITTSGSSGGGGSFFGVFGGGASRKWSTINVRETGNDVTFTIDSPSISVIAMISEVLPTLPAPNLSDTWADNAWIERPQ